MKNFKAVSMDCNKEQFESIREDLIALGCSLALVSSFNERIILVNNRGGVEKSITNFLEESCKISWDRTYIGAFDKETFLQACGKVDQKTKLPTKWCVKHTSEALDWIRKNAELNGEYIKEREFYMMPSNSAGNNSSDFEPDGYTIISEKQFKELVLKEKEEVKKSGWYKNGRYSRFLSYYDFETGVNFGISSLGNWVVGKKSSKDNFVEDNTKATNEQVLQRLTEEAEKRGYVGKDLKIKLDGTEYLLEKEKGSFQVASNLFFYQGATIMYNGIWADIVVEPLVQSKANMLRDRGWNVYPEQAADELINDISSFEVVEPVNVSEIESLKEDNKFLFETKQNLHDKNVSLKKEKTTLLKSRNRYKQLYQQEKLTADTFIKDVSRLAIENSKIQIESTKLKQVNESLLETRNNLRAAYKKQKKQLKLTLLAISAILVSNIIYLALC